MGGAVVVTDQVFAFSSLVAAAALCAGAVGFSLGRFTARTRARVTSEGHSEAALALALEDGLARLKAQQKLMSDRAEASERLSTQIVDNLTAGLLLVDHDGRIVLLNPAGQRLLDVPADAVGTPFERALQPAPALVDLIARCRAAHDAAPRQTVSRDRPAGTLHLGVTVSPIDRDEGRSGVICLFTDLTSVVEMEDQLRLKEALARLGELTAGLAHEFRNGLATIHGYARLLDPALLPERYRPFVQSLRDETDQLGRVVTNFLNFARTDPIACVRVSLSEVATRAADEVRRELPEGGALVTAGVDGDVEGDEQLLKQVFDNLYRNAVQACAGAGVVPRITVHGEMDVVHRTAHVFVDDNGPGIPPADRVRVFQPFVTTRLAGTGLGLAIVQRIVLAHNGRVSIAGSPEGGARFELTFPCLPATSDQSKLHSAA